MDIQTLKKKTKERAGETKRRSFVSPSPKSTGGNRSYEGRQREKAEAD